MKCCVTAVGCDYSNKTRHAPKLPATSESFSLVITKWLVKVACYWLVNTADAVAVLPNGLIFSDFGPNSDFFGDFGPKMVRIGTQKSYLEG